MFFYIIAVVFAVFLNSSISPFLGLYEIFSFSFTPILLLIVRDFFIDRISFRSPKNKIAIILIIFGFFIMAFKMLIDYKNTFKSEIQLLIFPALLSIYLENISIKKIKILKVVILIFFILECFIAIYERSSMTHVFNYDSSLEVSKNWQFRSRSLMGDPLNNAMIVSTLLSFFVLANFSIYKKYILFFLGFTSLFCFNARAAIIMSAFCILPYLFFITYNDIDFKKNRLLIMSVLVFGFSFFISYIIKSDLGGRLIHNEKLFDGSAQTRLDILSFSKYINYTDFLWGNAKNLSYVSRKLEAASIENGIIAFIIYYGVVFAPVLLIMLIMFLHSKLRRFYYPSEIKFLLFVFIILGITNTNLFHSEQWIIFIFSYYSFRCDSFIKKNTSNINKMSI